jgi:hypothetical protein
VGRAVRLVACIGALAACGDDDGIGIFSQPRDIAGTWVRVPPPEARIGWFYVSDTLTLRDDGTGRWSVENEFADVVPPSRSLITVVLDARGPALFLNVTDISTCPVCIATLRAPHDSAPPARALIAAPPARPRLLTLAPPPHYRVQRTSAESLELEELLSTDRPRLFYRRVSRRTLP